MDETSSRLEEFTKAEQWYTEIARLYQLSLQYALGLHAPHSQIIPLETDVVHIGGPYVKFHVDLNMPDAFINAAFRRFLEIAREQVPSPVVMSGPAARNGRFEKTYKRWKDLKIVEFCELLAWRAQQPELKRKKIKDAMLGRWIGRHLSKDVSVTRNALKKALAQLAALGSQVSYEMAQGENATQDIKQHIAREIQLKIPYP